MHTNVTLNALYFKLAKRVLVEHKHTVDKKRVTLPPHCLQKWTASLTEWKEGRVGRVVTGHTRLMVHDNNLLWIFISGSSWKSSTVHIVIVVGFGFKLGLGSSSVKTSEAFWAKILLRVWALLVVLPSNCQDCHKSHILIAQHYRLGIIEF